MGSLAVGGWSGLFDGVHGDGLTLFNKDPALRLYNLRGQKRGSYGVTKALGGTVPATRKRGDYVSVDDTPGPAKNFMKIPGTATDGVNPPDRDIEVMNAHGEARPLSDDATLDPVDATDEAYTVDTTLKHVYPGDKSGQTGPGF